MTNEELLQILLGEIKDLRTDILRVEKKQEHFEKKQEHFEKRQEHFEKRQERFEKALAQTQKSLNELQKSVNELQKSQDDMRLGMRNLRLIIDEFKEEMNAKFDRQAKAIHYLDKSVAHFHERLNLVEEEVKELKETQRKAS